MNASFTYILPYYTGFTKRLKPGLFNRIRNETQKNEESAIYGRKA